MPLPLGAVASGLVPSAGQENVLLLRWCAGCRLRGNAGRHLRKKLLPGSPAYPAEYPVSTHVGGLWVPMRTLLRALCIGSDKRALSQVRVRVLSTHLRGAVSTHEHHPAHPSVARRGAA